MKVSAIVPIFNEEKTVEGVVETLLSSPSISEVICINDGSIDKSLEILESLKGRAKLKIIHFKKNHGKGRALAQGIKKAKGEIVAFFDSDLLNFRLDHVDALLKPILLENFKAVLGIPFQEKKDLYRPWVVSLTGERAYFKKELLPYLKDISQAGYGVETFLNSLYKKRETKIVALEGLLSPPKTEKWGPKEALKEYLREARDIARAFSKSKRVSLKNSEALKKLAKEVDFNTFLQKLTEIRNQELKRIFEKYLLRYFHLVKRKFDIFLSENF